MTVTVYKSTDGSAPTLTGQAGSLTTLLDAVLVNGYGAKAAAGWTIGQTTTNKRQYVQGAGSTGKSLWVDDTAVTTAKEARCAGYATMSATTPTGTGQFPTGAQSAIGTGMLVIRKSTTADATARVWTIVADETCFMLFTETGDYTAPVVAFSFYFGDFFTYGSGDTSNCVIIGRTIENTALAVTSGSSFIQEPFPHFCLPNSTHLSNTIGGHYVAAGSANVGGSTPFGKHTDTAKTGWDGNGAGMQMGALGRWSGGGSANTYWPNQFSYPNPTDNGLYMAPVFVHHQGQVRGYLKGLWAPLQHLPLNHGDTFSGTGNLTGKTFQTVGLLAHLGSNTNGYGAQAFVETSDTWA